MRARWARRTELVESIIHRANLGQTASLDCNGHLLSSSRHLETSSKTNFENVRLEGTEWRTLQRTRWVLRLSSLICLTVIHRRTTSVTKSTCSASCGDNRWIFAAQQSWTVASDQIHWCFFDQRLRESARRDPARIRRGPARLAIASYSWGNKDDQRYVVSTAQHCIQKFLWDCVTAGYLLKKHLRGLACDYGFRIWGADKVIFYLTLYLLYVTSSRWLLQRRLSSRF